MNICEDPHSATPVVKKDIIMHGLRYNLASIIYLPTSVMTCALTGTDLDIVNVAKQDAARRMEAALLTKPWLFALVLGAPKLQIKHGGGEINLARYPVMDFTSGIETEIRALPSRII